MDYTHLIPVEITLLPDDCPINEAGKPIEVQVSPSAVRDLDRIIEVESILRAGKETDIKCKMSECNHPAEAKLWADLYRSKLNEECANIRERMALTFLPLVKKLVEARLLTISLSSEDLLPDKTYNSFCLECFFIKDRAASRLMLSITEIS